MLIFPSLLGLLISSVTSARAACDLWSESTPAGELDVGVLSEASGLAASRRFPGQLYHVADSPSRPAFYVSDADGSNLREVLLEPPPAPPYDIEAVSVGPCGEMSCVFLADIGGNTFRRTEARIVALRETAFTSQVEPLYTLRLSCPPELGDAEGFAVHPNGDLYLLGKPALSLLNARPARLYRLRAQVWQAAPERGHTLELIAELVLQDLPQNRLDVLSHIATDLAISPDGQRFTALTYGDAFEFTLDLATVDSATIDSVMNTAELNVEVVSRLVLTRLAQQESLTYLDGDTLLYGSEARTGESPLYKVSCLQRASE